jgi:hypothetical protein
MISGFARFKIHLIRVWSLMNIPVQLTQVGLLLYLTIKSSGNPLFYWLIPVLMVLTFALWWVDVNYLIVAESEYAVDKTPSWTQLKNDVAEIKLKLKVLK